MLTFLPLEEIDAMESWEGAQLNQAKEILAFELTKLVHGEEEANKAKEASHALFAGGGDSAHMPTLELTAADFADGDLDILALLVKAELAPSRSDARRAVQQGGVSAVSYTHLFATTAPRILKAMSPGTAKTKQYKNSGPAAIGVLITKLQMI